MIFNHHQHLHQQHHRHQQQQQQSNFNLNSVIIAAVINNSIAIAIMSVITLAGPITFLASRRRLMPC